MCPTTFLDRKEVRQAEGTRSLASEALLPSRCSHQQYNTWNFCNENYLRKFKCHSYLSPYSPELNLIEILWRRIKYTWLPFSAYACLNALSEALETILSQVGSEYQITFA